MPLNELCAGLGGIRFIPFIDALPKETRGYVPQFVAFTYLMNHANDHGIVAETYEYPIPHDTIQVSGYFNLETFAKHSTMPLADLQKMNPAITTTILPEYTNRYPLRVPRQQYGYFANRRRAILDSARQRPGVMEHILLANAEDIRYGNDSMGAWNALGRNPSGGHRTLKKRQPKKWLLRRKQWGNPLGWPHNSP